MSSRIIFELEEIIAQSRIPPTTLEVCRKISISQKEDISTTAAEALNLIKKNPDLFIEMHGRVVSTSDEKWKSAITSYWYILEILQPLYSSSDLQFIIAALFFYKRTLDISTSKSSTHQYEDTCTKDLLSDTLLTEPPTYWLDLIHTLDHKLDIHLNILRDLSELLRSATPQQITGIRQVLHSINTLSFNNDEFGIFYEHIIEANTARNYNNLTSRTPAQVCELMAAILDARYGRVYDPACGSGSLLTCLVKDETDGHLSFYGSDISYRSAQLTLMNLRMHNVMEARVRVEDSLAAHNELQYDYIISELPLIGKTHNSFDTPSFTPFIELTTSKLAHNGKAALIVSDRFLSSGGATEKFRRQLLGEDIIESIFSLPSGSLKPYTNGKSSIIVLNKAKPSHLVEKVRFINVQNLTPGSKTPLLDISIAIENYGNKEDSRYARTVSTDEVLKNGALNTSPYTESLQEVERLYREGKAQKLANLVEIISGSANREATHAQGETPYIKIENLEKDILDMKLAIERATNKTNKQTHSKRTLISDECLLIARIGDNLKPTIFKPTKRAPEIITHTGVIALKPIKDASIDIEYLYYQLYTPLIQKQIEQKRAGSVMPFLNRTALSGIIIPIMPLQSQREFIATQKINIISAEKEKVNQRLKAIGFEEESIQKESDIISTLVHELRPKLVKINSLSNKLNRIIKNNSIEHLKEYTEQEIAILTDPDGLAEPPENHEIGDITRKISESSKELNDTLSLVKEIMTLSLNQGDFRNINLLQFLKEKLLNRSSEPPQRYKIEIKGADIEAHIHPQSFQHILDQLIANSEHHAFTTPSQRDKISFTVKEDKERKLAIIEYSNNGTPFKLKKDDYIQFFTKSKSSKGSGIGGNYIYRIIKAHNGDIDIDESPKSGFFMRIEIPIKEKQ
ncbi:type I restriction-modification system DNA methylase subunit [Pseudomonas alcaligenes]|nr:type I restriction-modification system DNA methylase subunit [Pseudomonas alcaligenes]